MGVQEALSAALVDDRAYQSLMRGDVELQVEFGLTSSEFHALRMVKPSAVELMRAEVRAKRWDALDTLPATHQLLDRWDGGHIRDSYLSCSSRPRDDFGASGWVVTQAAHLVTWLKSVDWVPLGVTALAEYELAVLSLAENRCAGDAAEEWATRERRAVAVTGATRLRRSAATRFVGLDHDVLSVPADPKQVPAQRRVHVLLHKEWPVYQPSAYRVGEFVRRLGEACDGVRTVADIVLAATSETPGLADRATQTLIMLAERGVLMEEYQ